MSSALTLSMPFTWTGGFWQTDPPRAPVPTIPQVGFEQEANDSKLSLGAIAGVTGAVIACLILGAIIVMFSIRKQEEESVSMAGEEINIAYGASRESVTALDNPLWMMRHNDDTSDPFVSDFE